MNRSDHLPWRKKRFWITALKSLFLYALIPFLLLKFLSQPVGSAVRQSQAAVFQILLAALGAVVLNGFIYAAIHRKCPPLPVFSFGALCLLIVIIILYEALPVYGDLRPTLAVIGGSLAMAMLLLLSFWFAARPSRPAHAVSVCLRILYGLILFAMACQIIRDIESRLVSVDTWITAGVLAAGILAFNAPKIISACRRKAAYRKANHVAMGKIYQIIGETHLDMDDDPVTRDYALIQYAADGGLYETRADISRFTVRRFGKDAFVGRDVPVFYNPANPAEAFVNKIDRHLFDQ